MKAGPLCAPSLRQTGAGPLPGHCWDPAEMLVNAGPLERLLSREVPLSSVKHIQTKIYRKLTCICLLESCVWRHASDVYSTYNFDLFNFTDNYSTILFWRYILAPSVIEL